MKDTRITRKSRQRDELPYPDLGSQHWKNKDVLWPVYSSRVAPEIKEKFNEWVKSKGITKRQATEFAMQEAMKADPIIKP